MNSIIEMNSLTRLRALSILTLTVAPVCPSVRHLRAMELLKFTNMAPNQRTITTAN
nr:hypothetical protein [uncultured Desulfobacter sp.]